MVPEALAVGFVVLSCASRAGQPDYAWQPATCEGIEGYFLTELNGYQVLERLNRSGGPQGLADAQSNYDQARADCDLADKALARQKALLARGFVPQSAVDDAESPSTQFLAQLEATDAFGQMVVGPLHERFHTSGSF